MTDRPGRRRTEETHHRGFSLASLLLLTAVVAVFLAAICTVWLHSDRDRARPDVYAGPNLDEALLAISVMGGLMVGSLVGLVIGASRVRPLRGAFLGTFVGMIAGAASGALLAVPGKMLPLGVGSLVIVLFGAVVRYYSGGPPHQ
jgi:hypothetical protein